MPQRIQGGHTRVSAANCYDKTKHRNLKGHFTNMKVHASIVRVWTIIVGSIIIL